MRDKCKRILAHLCCLLRLRQHDYLPARETEGNIYRVFLRCQDCGNETPGWTAERRAA